MGLFRAFPPFAATLAPFFYALKKNEISPLTGGFTLWYDMCATPEKGKRNNHNERNDHNG